MGSYQELCHSGDFFFFFFTRFFSFAVVTINNLQNQKALSRPHQECVHHLPILLLTSTEIWKRIFITDPIQCQQNKIVKTKALNLWN